MCWEASQRVKTPLWNMSSCLLYYSLYFFFVFLCIYVITSSVFYVFFVMYTLNVECRTMYLNRCQNHICFLFVSLSCLCVTSYVPSVSLSWIGSRLVDFSTESAFAERKDCRPSCLQHGHNVYCQTCRTVPNSPLERLVLHLSSLMQLYSPDSSLFFFFPPLSLLHHLLKRRRTVRLCPLAVFLRV